MEAPTQAVQQQINQGVQAALAAQAGQVASLPQLKYVEVPENTVFVFRSVMPSCQYVFRSGKVAPFINHEYATSMPQEIAELNYEIEMGHPHIKVSPQGATKSTIKVDPLEEVRAKAIAEYIANQAKANDINNDRGTSEQGKLNVSNSTSVAAGMAGSAAGNGAALLALKVGAGALTGPK